MKAYDESYSKIITGHKYKDNDNDKDSDKDKVPEIPSICYIFEILMTHSMIYTSPSSSCSCCSPWSPCSGHMKNHFYRAECITVSGFFIYNKETLE